MNSISIAVEADTDRHAKNAIQSGLFDANVAFTGDGHFDAVLIVARDSNASLVGGVVGEAYWGWINFTAVWVHPEYRRHGLASQMLKAAEAEAVRLGYTQAYLDTFSFQAPELYLRAGYEVFGTLDNFPLGAKRFFLSKTIAPKSA